MTRDTRRGTVGAKREAWAALAYLALYTAYNFLALESELLHWVGLVALPFLVAWLVRPREARGLAATLESVGLRRGNLTAGLGWALLLGAAFSVFQVYFGGNAAEIRELLRSGRALWMAPLTFLLMMLMAGFTEEFFYRGFLQTRIERLLGSPWLAVGVVAFLFGVYHLPYAYLNPNWPSFGDWHAAWSAALGNGVPAGLVLGALYVKSGRNLLACAVLHSMVNMMPAMTMIRFGRG